MEKHTDRPVWLITGAAGALGSELVRQLLRSGKDCIALDRNARGLNQLHDQMVADGLSPPALMPMDLAGAGPDEYAKLAETLESEFGRLDVLLHGAAEFVALRPLLHQPAEEWFKTIQAGLTGPFLLSVALMPLLSQTAKSRVVFINDGHCLDKPANWAAYGVAQAGRRQMLRSLEQEAGRRGPRFMEIDPGPFFSPLRTAAWPSESPDDLPQPDSAAARVIELVCG
jgi:NAD(P)-dependent dehydrogenase (short-subunit alcohol dehydrogenase family)